MTKKFFLRFWLLLTLGSISITVFTSCNKNESVTSKLESQQVPDVSSTPCKQDMLRSSGYSDKVDVDLTNKGIQTTHNNVDVKFTNKGVQITHYNFEVTCDFTNVDVTYTFVNGVLRITQQGYPNQAKCVCYSDVSYTIEGILQSDVNVIFINGEQVYCYNKKEDDSLIFSYFYGSAWVGLDENLKITADSTYYSFHHDLSGESFKTSIKTSKEQWDNLTRTFNLEIFRKIQNESCGKADGYERPTDLPTTGFSVTINGENYSFYNGECDEYYKQMQDFFSLILKQVEICRKKESFPQTINSILIAQGELFGNGQEGIAKQNFVIKTQENWEKLIKAMNTVNNVSRNFTETDIDFSKYQIIAVFDNVRGLGGCCFKITNITEYADKIVVDVYNATPEVGWTAMNQPYHIVKIPVSGKQVVFQ